MESLPQKIESILFFQSEPIKIKKLGEILNIDQESIAKSLQELSNNLSGRGIRLIQNDDSVSLVTSPENFDLIEKIKKEEKDKDLSKAAVETLSIILYRGPVKRSEIDYIRGVNSQFSLRALMIKGLIEREICKDDERTYVYNPSIELLAHLGLSSIKELPEYQDVNNDIDNFISSEDKDEEA